MILIQNVMLPLETDFSDLTGVAAKTLHIDLSRVLSAELFRRSVDARRKNDVCFCCTLLVSAKGEERLKKLPNVQPYCPEPYVWQTGKPSGIRPVIAGFGPAGMFAALTLARAGLCPIVLERGKRVEERTADVKRFFANGILDPESNIQFGEGGAGTFSDGKLNTGIKDPRCRVVLESFVEFGAPKRILTDARPHIGTDILVTVVKNLRQEMERLGGEVRFSAKLDGIFFSDGVLNAVSVNGEKISCDTLILATGHSARDVFSLLRDEDVSMERKPFSVGVRIEHLQSEINRALYGDFAGHPALPAADYRLAVHLPDGRGVYTFCMCPGGQVINASSESGGLAVNGMSNSHRDGTNANSAVLVGVEPEDFPSEDVLAGCEFQRMIERRAYEVGQGRVPTVTVGEFLTGIPDLSKKVKPTVLPQVCHADFDTIFPKFVVDALRVGIPALDRRLHGFADPAAILTAPETRSSSPVRILRGEDRQSPTVKGLYPCGEGAGYAGGITSAAVDGIRTAEAVISATGNRQY